MFKTHHVQMAVTQGNHLPSSCGRSCPVNRVTRFTEKITTAACTVDVSVLLTSFTRHHQDTLQGFYKGKPGVSVSIGNLSTNYK